MIVKYTAGIVLSILFISNSYALCPLKSFTLESLREVTQSLELSVKQLNMCDQRGDLEASSKHVSEAVSNIFLTLLAQRGEKSKLYRKIYGFDQEGPDGAYSTIGGEYARLFKYDNLGGSDVDTDMLGSDIESAMTGIQNIANILHDRNFKKDCGHTVGALNFGVAAAEVFTQLAPIAVGAITGGAGAVATKYILGSFAAGKIASSVLGMLDTRQSIYDMGSAEKRNAFVASSCVHHELAMNAHVLDNTINLPQNYLTAEKEKLVGIKNAIIEANRKRPPFQLIMYHLDDMYRQLDEIRKSSDSFGSLFDEDYDVAAEDYSEGGEDESEYYELEEELEEDNLYSDSYDDVNGGYVSDIGPEILCDAVESYFMDPVLKQKKQFFLVNAYMFVSQYAQEMGKTIENPYVLKAYGNNLVASMFEAFTDPELECDFDAIYDSVRTVSRFARKQLRILGHRYNTEYTPMMEDKEALESQFKYFRSLSEINMKINVIEKKVTFLEKLGSDNYQIDLKEILSSERRIANQLFKGKTLAYHWLRYNHKETKYHLNTFAQKYKTLGSALEVGKNAKNPKVCKKLGSAVRDYRLSKINVESNRLYCESMWPFISEVDFPEVHEYCALYMEERDIDSSRHSGRWYTRFLLKYYPVSVPGTPIPGGLEVASYHYKKDLSSDIVFERMASAEPKYSKANKAYYRAGCERNYIERDLMLDSEDLDRLDDIILDEIIWEGYY